MTDGKHMREQIADARHGRLSPEGRVALARHLEECAECRAFDVSERELDRALARMPPRPAPAVLRARLAATVDSGAGAPTAASAATALAGATPPKARVSLRRRAVAVGFGAALAGSVLGAAGWLYVAERADEIVEEAVNDHLRVLYAAHPLEIESGGIHQVKPWFEGKLDFAPVLGFDGDDEFVLTGGSIAYFVDRKAAAFVFKRRLHVVTLFVFRADGLPWPHGSSQKLGRGSAFRSHSRGFNVLLFRSNDLGYALVSDTEPATLERLGEKIEASL
jgi:anti-sigma factor RsiW